MRVYNMELLQQSLRDIAFTLAPGFSQYSGWLGKSVSKWLLKNNSEFSSKFLAPISSKTSSLMEGLPVRYYAQINGVDTRLYFDNPFDQKDIAAGNLTYYTHIGFMSWFLQTYPAAVDARDFFLAKVRENLAFDLRKYTLSSLPAVLREWHIERERILAEEAKLRLAAYGYDQSYRTDLQKILNVSRALVSVPLEREKKLDEAWLLLREGIDYRVLGTLNGYEVLQYLSTSGLEWESAYKLNCINGSSYKNMLTCPTSMLLSIREFGLRSRSLYTVECHYYQEWVTAQFERWGYAHPLYDAPGSETDKYALTKALEEMLKTVKRPETQLVREISRGAR